MDPIIQKSLDLARILQQKVVDNISSKEIAFHRKMEKLLKNPENKALLIELLDRAFRCEDKQKSFAFIRQVFGKYGVADFFSPFEQLLLLTFLKVGGLLPSVSVPFFINYLRAQTRSLVLDSKESILRAHIQERKKENITLNINLIGEEVLGEGEANFRLEKYEQALKTSYISYISIKITTIFSQINIIDFEESKNEIVKRLSHLYEIAQDQEKIQNTKKFINLDMEEFRDLELTAASFMEAISHFPNLSAGIVLQAYIPDSYEYLQKLFAFSKQRVESGGEAIKIRFVKGANMEQEMCIASFRGWELPTFEKKVDTDSNYKTMLDFVLSEERYKYIRIGIASHNIFEIAYAYTRIQEANALQYFTFEMLEGMSEQASLELSKMHSLILYAPVCDQEHFNNTIAYLVRRLDENTHKDNFMRYFFNLKVGDKAWEEQKQLFLDSITRMKNINHSTKRKQNRLKTTPKSQDVLTFINEPDTDFILKANREWAEKIKEKYEHYYFGDIYPVIGDQAQTKAKENLEVLNMKDKIDQRDIAKVYLASQEQLRLALQTSKETSAYDFETIGKLLLKTANIFREKRGDLIGTAALEVGKNFIEIDAEVSEGIDFLEFYPHSLATLQKTHPKTTFTPKGVGVVIAPWNFPIGISTGSIAAALAAGNKVIYKPSSLSPITGFMVCQCFWDAGISRDMLIYLPSKGSDLSEIILKSSDVDFCILTGGEDTAYKILEANPSLTLSAETGGKNATIVTKMADRDSAVKNIIHSAFSNSGQKCSATSLLILEREVYEDENFKNTLLDATKSLSIGGPFKFFNKITAMSDKPSQKITEILETIQPHQKWLLKPTFIDNNPYLMSPGILWGVKQQDTIYDTELFAPILSVMCADDLENAINIANQTGYGLTAALESLDENEWEIFSKNLRAGNLYINKPSTGAIVLRQPFGGVKKSAIGYGRKVGCYNYITQFLNILEDQVSTPNGKLEHSLISRLRSIHNQEIKDKINKMIEVTQDCIFYLQNEFSHAHEFTKVRGEDNLFSYVPIENMAYIMQNEDEIEDAFKIILYAYMAKIPLYINYDSRDSKTQILKEIFHQLEGIIFIDETLQNFKQRLSDFERIWYLGKDQSVYAQAASLGKVIIKHRPRANARFELLYYFNEKALSISFHRYGNLGRRALQGDYND